MKNKILILVLAIAFSIFGFSASVFAAEIDPLAVETKEKPSETYLSREKRSIGASTEVQTISAPTRGLTKQSDALQWGDPFLPGGDGWEIGEEGNVGYPVGDASIPMLLSMFFIYFIYRGVSSTKRKNNF